MPRNNTVRYSTRFTISQTYGASGGGGRSLPVISKQLFKKLFSQLSKKVNRKVVADKQMQEWKWKNDHANHRVYAITCQKTVVDRSPKPPHPCSECSIVLHSKAFKNAIRKPIPSDENSKFINYRFRNPLLGSIYARTIGVREIVEDEVHFLIYCHDFFKLLTTLHRMPNTVL